MEQNIVSIFFYRAASSIISPLLVTLPFFLYWKYVKKKTVSEKSVFFLNVTIPIFIAVIYILILFYTTTIHILLITFFLAILLLFISLPLSFLVGKINTWIILNVFQLIDHKERSKRAKYTALFVFFTLLVIFSPKSQVYVISWTKDSPPRPAIVKKCFCAGISTTSLKIKSINQYCLGLTYQCINNEIMHDPTR
jgi:hypothetical protein